MVSIERLVLDDLCRSPKPLWGGHLERGDPITDRDMQRWLDNGWIAVSEDRSGYVLTDLGRRVVPTLR
jgi:hypothetical protein